MRLTAAALILLGAGIGVLGSTVNPFATGIASGFAGTTISEGLIGRVVLLVVGTIIGILFVMRYAEKVKKDPTKSLIYDEKADNEKQFLSGKSADTEFGKFTGRHKVILVLFFLAFVVMVYGVIPWEDLGIAMPTWWWWFPEMTAYFLFFGILIGIVGKLSEKNLVNTFVDGARDMLGVALIIGVARGITVIMNNGLITDTVLYWAEQAVAGLGGVGFIIVTYLLYIPLSFLIPSSSGLATVSMPIMAPLAQFAGVPRLPGRHGLPGRQRPGEPDHPDFGGGDGRSGHRPGGVWHLDEVCLAAACCVLPSCWQVYCPESVG